MISSLLSVNTEILNFIDLLSKAKAMAHKVGSLANQYAEQSHEIELLYRDANRQVEAIEAEIAYLKRQAELKR